MRRALAERTLANKAKQQASVTPSDRSLNPTSRWEESDSQGRSTARVDGDTQSIDSCRHTITTLSTMATASDLPGTGRVLDKYFFQPSGRFVERKVNQILAERKSRQKRGLRHRTRDALNTASASTTSLSDLLAVNYQESRALRASDDADTIRGTVITDSVSTYEDWTLTSTMSTNQTCDDLPGPGRIIDSYFYQSGGRYLELKINDFMTKRNINNAIRHRIGINDIAKVHRVIDSILRTNIATHHKHKNYMVEHRFMQEEFWNVRVRLSLSSLLYVWGGQNIGPSNEETILEESELVVQAINSPHLHLQIEALNCAGRLLNVYPRLRRYYDLSAIRRRACDREIMPHVKRGFEERGGVDDLLRQLSNVLPTTEINKSNMTTCRPHILSFIADILEDPTTDASSESCEVLHFLQQLLRFDVIFQFQDGRYTHDDPVALFWQRFKDISENPQLRSYSGALSVSLRYSLHSTWESLSYQNSAKKTLIPASNSVEGFSRLSILIFSKLHFEVDPIRGLLPSPYAYNDEQSYFISLMDSRSPVERNDINRIWMECMDGNQVQEVQGQHARAPPVLRDSKRDAAAGNPIEITVTVNKSTSF